MRYFLLLAFVLIFWTGSAQKSKYDQAVKTARDTIRKMMERGPIAGASVTVMVNGVKVWSEGFGCADLEQHVNVLPSKTKFRIGSISKSLTAAGLARLYEANKIILDSSIYFYLPEYPKYKYRPTIRQVAGHIAGVRHYKGDEWFNHKHFNSVSDGLAMFKDDSLNFKPGEKYQYTSHGFNLLSAAMEKAAGTDFLTYMKREVFDNLNLTNTVPDVNDSIIDSRVRFYDVVGKSWKNARAVDNSYKWAGGGFISTSEDIALFGNALLGSKFLKPETVRLFTTAQKLNNGTATTYGMGFFTGKDSKGIAYFGHSGGSVGGTTDLVVYPNERIVVVILTNVSDAGIGGRAREIGRMFMLK